MPIAIELLLVMLVALAAWNDFRTRRIPNWITVPGALAGFALQVWYSGLQGAASSIEGAALGIGLVLLLFIARGMGGGDVKLFGAVGALAGPQTLVLIFVISGLLGGIAAAAFVIVTGKWHAKMPYAPVIAVGTLLSLVAS
jgi:prepilin peptidase CpaA